MLLMADLQENCRITEEISPLRKYTLQNNLTLCTKYISIQSSAASFSRLFSDKNAADNG